MKRGSSMSSRENEVAEILVKLRTLILELECGCGCGFLPHAWGRKRKRSAIAVTPKPDAASSPATPFSFSPSDSDDNNTLFTPNLSLNTKRERYLKIIQELTKDNDLLNREIKNVKCYFDKLKDYNFKLKARKQELCVGPNRFVHKQLQWQFPGMAHHGRLIFNQTAGPPRMRDGGVGVAELACGQSTTSLGVASFSGDGLGLGNANSNNDVGPAGIPDLNVALEEPMGAEEWFKGLDVNPNKDRNRAVAAQARQNRIQIYRFKNPIANSKTRYSCR